MHEVTPDRKRQSRHEILSVLRREIVAGQLQPGAQLPTRTELESRFHASRHTVQRAIDHLRRAGFVRVNGRQASYVSDRPPHLYRFALIFKSMPQHERWNSFFAGLERAATGYSGATGDSRFITVHHGVEDHLDNREMAQLRRDVQTRSLAGLFFPEHPFVTELARSELGTAPVIACAAIMEPRAGDSMGTVYLESMWELAFAELAATGCRRVALLVAPIDTKPLLAGASRYGLTIRPEWVHRVCLDHPACAREVTHLLLAGRPGERPDGLFVADDNLVPYAQAGILDAGVRVPDELRVIAHSNFPWATPSALPAVRLGYDVREVLAAGVAELASQQAGRPPGARRIGPRFERDVPP